MANVGWDESSPPDTESAGLGDDRIRSLMTSLRVGLDDEHVWPSGGGDAGKHRLGSVRAYYGPQSAVSSSGTDGKLMMTSDTSRLFHAGSGGTSYIGGSTVLSLAPGYVGYPQRSHFVEEFGLVQVPGGSGGSVVVNIPNSGYSGVPIVSLTQNEISSAATVGLASYGAIGLTASSFVVFVSGGIGQTFTFAWRSLGTRVL
jgi:hypothetical protein